MLMADTAGLNELDETRKLIEKLRRKIRIAPDIIWRWASLLWRKKIRRAPKANSRQRSNWTRSRPRPIRHWAISIGAVTISKPQTRLSKRLPI